MKVSKVFVLATVVALSGCVAVNDAVVKTDKEVAKLLDKICVNLSDDMRAQRLESINEFTKVADLKPFCE